MPFIDYYKVLGISKSATEKEIKKAYRKLARKFHPDVNPNDTEAEKKFQAINEANEVLSNPENRKKYDQYGKDWQHADEIERAKQQQRSQRSRSGQESYSDFGGGSGYSDFFESMFGGSAGGYRRSTQFKGQDFNATLNIPLSQVYTSQKQTLTINGKNIRLTIPAGVEDGQTIKIKGYGGPGVGGGPKGDLFITFEIQNDTAFKREKSNLYKTIPIDLYTAVLGGEIKVTTFDGTVKLKVKPGTQNNTKVKLKGKGFPKYKQENKFGDFFITYQVSIPQNLSEKEKSLFQELAKLQ